MTIQLRVRLEALAQNAQTSKNSISESLSGISKDTYHTRL